MTEKLSYEIFLHESHQKVKKKPCIDLIPIQRYGSSRPLCVALQCEGVTWTADFYLARPMWFAHSLYGLIAPEGRIGRKGKSGPLFFSFFPFLPFLPSGTINPTSLVPCHMAGAKIKSPVHGTPSHCNATQRGRLDPYLFIGIRSIRSHIYVFTPKEKNRPLPGGLPVVYGLSYPSV
jgi:hypothetical protein